MKLAIKLSSLLIVAIVALLGVNGYLAVRWETDMLRADMEHDAQLLGHAMKGLVSDVWTGNGEQRALELIADANRAEDVVQIRWVWLAGPTDDRYRPRVDLQQLQDLTPGAGESFPLPGRKGGALVTYVPVRVDGQRLGALELSESMSVLKAHNRAIIERTLGVMGALLAAGGVSVLILGTLLVGRPLRELVERVRQIGEGDLGTTLVLYQSDEFGELADALNDMCRRLAEAQENVRAETEAHIAALEQLRHADRLTTVGRLASGIAHEVGTPLNVISARAKQIAGGGLSGAGVQENAVIVGRQADRIAAIIRRLLDFARPSRSRRKLLDLREVVERAVGLLSPLAEKHQVSLDVLGGDEPLLVNANAGQIEQVLTNLIVNAIQSMPEGGRAEVRFACCAAKPPLAAGAAGDRFACVSVIDQGVGISEDDLPKVFEPFFTTKEVGEGTGLGLSLAHGIVREHGGWIDVTSSPGEGSCFTICLPLAGDDRSPEKADDNQADKSSPGGPSPSVEASSQTRPKSS
jgi:two-component system NtrC family sensor kinase